MSKPYTPDWASTESAKLVAELTRLREENERLRAELREALDWKDKMTEVAGRNRERAEAAEAEARAVEAGYRNEIRRADENYLRATRAEAKLAEVQELADHQIPVHAYGDHEAACDMAERLAKIRGL